MIKQLVIATGNLKKLKEFERLLAPLGIEVLPQSVFNVPEAPEPHFTFLENALAKARNAARVTGLPALADDSGICVHALGGNPGVNSAYYAGEHKNDADNNAKLFKKGQDKVLAPLVKRGDIKIVRADWAEDWKPENAKRITDAQGMP